MTCIGLWNPPGALFDHFGNSVQLIGCHTAFLKGLRLFVSRSSVKLTSAKVAPVFERTNAMMASPFDTTNAKRAAPFDTTIARMAPLFDTTSAYMYKVTKMFFDEAATVLQQYEIASGSKYTLKIYHRFFPYL